MQAIWNDTVIAEAPREDLIKIEGNWYFPPTAIKDEFYHESDHHTTCFWKGEADYYDVVVGDKTNEAAAWYYPVPMDGSVDRVGQDFANYVAFWQGVTVKEEALLSQQLIR